MLLMYEFCIEKNYKQHIYNEYDISISLGFESTKLTPGTVTLDDLTIDSLKQKMQEIDLKLQGKY